MRSKYLGYDFRQNLATGQWMATSKSGETLKAWDISTIKALIEQSQPKALGWLPASIMAIVLVVAASPPVFGQSRYAADVTGASTAPFRPLKKTCKPRGLGRCVAPKPKAVVNVAGFTPDPSKPPVVTQGTGTR